MLQRLAMVAGLVLAAASPVLAQQIDVGLKGGLNIATVDADDSQSRVGVLVGGSVSMPINPTLAIRPEILYAQKGATGDGEGELRLKLDYFEIPVLAELTFARQSSRRPFVVIGPAFGFSTNSEVKFEGENVPIDELVKGHDVSLVIGGGVNYHRVGLEVRYTMGLTKVFTDEVEDFLGDNVKNRTLSFVVSYVIQR